MTITDFNCKTNIRQKKSDGGALKYKLELGIRFKAGGQDKDWGPGNTDTRIFHKNKDIGSKN